MENIFLISGVVSIIYFLAKFIEMRFVTSDSKSPKVMIRDSLLVYVSSVIAYYVLEQFKTIQTGGTNLEAFTDNPGF